MSFIDCTCLYALPLSRGLLFFVTSLTPTLEAHHWLPSVTMSRSVP